MEPIAQDLAPPPIVEMRPDFTDEGAKLGPNLPYFYDFVFRLGVNKDAQGNSFRFLQTAPDIQFVAKDRSGKLDAMEYPHLGNVITKALS